MVVRSLKLRNTFLIVNVTLKIIVRVEVNGKQMIEPNIFSVKRLLEFIFQTNISLHLFLISRGKQSR